MAQAGASGLLRRLLGERFAAQDAPLQIVHAGCTAEWRGRATVRRGRHVLARLACWVAGLPPEGSDVPLRVRIEARDGSERWIRHYADAAPMISTLQASGDLLIERIGPAVNTMLLWVDAGTLRWKCMRLRLLGITLPQRAFDIGAKVWGEDSRYQFEVHARFALIGDVIRYRGYLNV